MTGLFQVYGKMNYMWQNASDLIETVADLTEVHATVADALDEKFPVVNHGFLPGPLLHALMRKVKIFLGLGFPYEGPAPLEAIASGAVYINPLFKPPKSRKTHAFFAEKPTLREVPLMDLISIDVIIVPYIPIHLVLKSVAKVVIFIS